MRRREFICLGGAALASWPKPLSAQRVRRIGVLMLYAEGDPEARTRTEAFEQALAKAGWMPGKDLLIEYQWGLGDADWIRGAAARMLTHSPDLVVLNGTAAVRAAQPVVQALPIVFIGVSDPVGQGVVASLAHPGGNATGFSNIEPSMGSKWIELLKEISPDVRRVAMMFHPDNSSASLLAGMAEQAAQKFAVEVSEARVTGADEIEAAMGQMARQPGGGIILPAEPFTASHRTLIVMLALRHRLPLVAALSPIAREGALMSYGVNIPAMFGQSAEYVSRILRGEKPADLPVQQPTKFEMVVNLKTAKSLGLTVPQTILVAADEVIE